MVLARRCATSAGTSASGNSAMPSSNPTLCLATSSALYRAVSPSSCTRLHVLWHEWKKTPLYVDLLAKHGRHSLYGRHLEVGDSGGWVGVEAERHARLSDGLQHLRVESRSCPAARDARRAARSTNDVAFDDKSVPFFATHNNNAICSILCLQSVTV